MTSQHKRGAALRGAARTSDVELRIKQAMKEIEEEIAANGGVFPKNGGLVTLLELSLRAGIDESTLYKKREANQLLKKFANTWLDSLKIIDDDEAGKPLRKTATQRADEWRDKYIALEKRHALTELELQSIKADLESLRTENALLVQRLGAISTTNVTPLKPQKPI